MINKRNIKQLCDIITYIDLVSVILDGHYQQQNRAEKRKQEKEMETKSVFFLKIKWKNKYFWRTISLQVENSQH